MCCLEGIIQFAPEGTASECSTEYSEGAERDALEEDILGDPEREEDLSGDEDPGTVEEQDTDDSDRDECETVTVGGVRYEVTSTKRKREEVVPHRPGVEPIVMGERVMASGLVRWKRIDGLPEDTRTEQPSL